jgi:DNA-binding response OmpR family regulator
MPIPILLIEDEAEITELMTVVLESPNIQMTTCDTAIDGLAKAKEVRPALVLVDILLPDMDGWSVYDAIRADPVIGSTPIVMLSALRQEFQPRRRFRTGPLDLYLTKPFDTVQLRTQIERMLNAKIWQQP